MCSNINCTQSTPCNSCLTPNSYIPCGTCDPCASPTTPCCKVKVESFKCVTNAEITSTALGIQPDDTLDEVIDKIINHFSTLTGFYKGDKGDKGESGPRGKRGCRGPIGTGGDSILSVVNNNDGTVTITTTLGDVFTFTVAASSAVVVENTLFVSKLGNDITALRTRFDKHFLTINAASVAAQVGDEIIVYAGSYTEPDNPFKSNVNYYLHQGVTVSSPNVIFGQYDMVRSIDYKVRGYGSFYNTTSGTGKIIDLTNRYSTILLESVDLEGGEDCIFLNCGNVDIKGETITTMNGKLLDISGYTEGTVHFKRYDASSTVDKTKHIDLHNLTLGDLNILTIKGDLVSDADLGCVVSIDAAGTSKILIDLNIKTVASPLVYTVLQNSGIVKFTGSIQEALFGWKLETPSSNTKLYMKDASIQVQGIALQSELGASNITIVLEDCYIARIFNSGGEVILLQNTGLTAQTNILLSNTRVVNSNTAALSFGIVMTGPILGFQIENSEIYSRVGLYCIDSDVSNNIALLTNLVSNYILDTTITNTVATTSVDITTTNPITVQF